MTGQSSGWSVCGGTQILVAVSGLCLPDIVTNPLRSYQNISQGLYTGPDINCENVTSHNRVSRSDFRLLQSPAKCSALSASS